MAGAPATPEPHLTLVAAAICPHPPVLVPELATGAATELDDARAACRRALDVLGGADVVFVVGADIGLRAISFAPWGVDVPVDVPEPVPLSLLIGGWLTRGTLRSFMVVDPAVDAQECAELGRDLAAASDRVGLLVMGDGSARHSEKAPGYVDPRAQEFDRKIADALSAGDCAALARLDSRECDELLVAGRVAWQVLAGAADRPMTADLFWSGAPYGVGYHVAVWT